MVRPLFSIILLFLFTKCDSIQTKKEMKLKPFQGNPEAEKVVFAG